ncbi:heterokaryon incompatibility protein-domain-containing protein [Xylaria arbuscula]|nr:heterokaryon incompatibility protein-domain-containing protein [Xylaria arbuscula]
MESKRLDAYHYRLLPMSFWVAELLPGKPGDPIACLLHEVEWSKLPKYEALSYAWGDPHDKTTITVHGKKLEVTKSLYVALTHLRYEDEARLLWADALCINQLDIPERGAQVRQMRRIFESAESIVLWLGPDVSNNASLAMSTISQIADFLCRKLDISLSDLIEEPDVYNRILFRNRDRIPLPDECDFVTERMWDALLWLYKHAVFTRVWIIQEINAGKGRVVYCGHQTCSWDALELVAGYIVLETAFSKSHGFTDAYCWWASTMSSDMPKERNWLHMLYLASNFSATDPRDVIYGLRGMIKCNDGGWLLDPDYSKTTIDVYRDSVEAAFINFRNTNALFYVHGVETPSWVPRWDEPMLFRNPFRFGQALPWKPAGDSEPKWEIDRNQNILSLRGCNIATVKTSETYVETYFGNAMIGSDEGKLKLQHKWPEILDSMSEGVQYLPLDNGTLTSAAVAFSFGLDDKCNPADEQLLFHNLVAYLKCVLDEETYRRYVSPETTIECEDGVASSFGKPVWDFKYPTAGFFAAVGKQGQRLIGCCIAPTQPGDILFVPHSSVYPLVLRPEGPRFRIRGFSFVHGVMKGETRDESEVTANIC